MSGRAERVIYETLLREGDQLRVTLSDFRGQQYVSVRHYWQPEGQAWVPTKRGITLSFELAAEVVEVLQRALSEDSEEPAA